MANGQTGIGFKPPRASNASAPVPVQQFSPLAGGLLVGQQVQRTGQTGMAGPPQVPNPGAVPPPGAVDINAKNRVPPGLMRFLNPGLLPNPNAVAPPGMVPGQPQPQMAAFGPSGFTPGALAPGVPGALPDPNAVAPVGLQQFPGGQLPRGQAPMVPQVGIPMRQPVAMGGSFLGAPAGGIPGGQGRIPRNLLNFAARNFGFMPQSFGQFGP